MTVDSVPRPTIFVSYSHQDEDLVQEFKQQLDHLQVPVWDDQDILPGTNWEEAIRQRLDQADIILLLVSPHFLASRSCYEIETKRALELQQTGQAQVIPVLLHACAWRATPIADLQWLPRGGKPIASWRNRDKAFRDVTDSIRLEVQKCQRVTRVIERQMARVKEAPASLDEWVSQKIRQREVSEKLELELEALLARSTTTHREQAVLTEMLLIARGYRRGLEEYNRRLLVDPSNAKLHLRKGEALLGLGRYQEALAAFEEAIRLAPDLSEAYYDRGMACERLAVQTLEDLKQQAQECYEKAKQLGIS